MGLRGVTWGSVTRCLRRHIPTSGLTVASTKLWPFLRPWREADNTYGSAEVKNWLEPYFQFTHTLSWLLQGHLYHHLIMPSCKECLCWISALCVNLRVFSMHFASSCTKVNSAFTSTHVLCSKITLLCVFQQSHNTSIIYMFRPATESMRYTSDEQTTARGPDTARLEVLSGQRQILK